jgi:hypothetical protein
MRLPSPLPHKFPRGVALLVAVCSGTWSVPAPAQAAPNPGNDEAVFKSSRRQATAYLRRKMWPMAQLEFEKARELPGGRKDFRTRFGLAKSYWEQLIVAEAMAESRVAVGLADDDRPKDKARAEALRDRIEEFFAGVNVVQDKRQVGQVTKGIIHLEVVGGLINRKKKTQFARIRERFAKTAVELPATIWLPFGDYKANGAPFSIRKGETAEAVTFLFLPDADRDDTAWWWWVGGGVAVAGVATAAAIILSDDGEAPAERQVRIDSVSFGEPAEE